jgi:uncharacterized protein YjbJ (UPF0337 family)
LKGSSNEIKDKLKQKYGNLTDDDLDLPKERRTSFLGCLQKKFGKSKEELRTGLDGLRNYNCHSRFNAFSCDRYYGAWAACETAALFACAILLVATA